MAQRYYAARRSEELWHRAGTELLRRTIVLCAWSRARHAWQEPEQRSCGSRAECARVRQHRRPGRAGARLAAQTQDVEEKEQCERMHAIIAEHKLDGQLRWLVAQKDRFFNGELYRCIAGARARGRAAPPGLFAVPFCFCGAGRRTGLSCLFTNVLPFYSRVRLPHTATPCTHHCLW